MSFVSLPIDTDLEDAAVLPAIACHNFDIINELNRVSYILAFSVDGRSVTVVFKHVLEAVRSWEQALQISRQVELPSEVVDMATSQRGHDLFEWD